MFLITPTKVAYLSKISLHFFLSSSNEIIIHDWNYNIYHKVSILLNKILEYIANNRTTLNDIMNKSIQLDLPEIGSNEFHINTGYNVYDFLISSLFPKYNQKWSTSEIQSNSKSFDDWLNDIDTRYKVNDYLIDNDLQRTLNRLELQGNWDSRESLDLSLIFTQNIDSDPKKTSIPTCITIDSYNNIYYIYRNGLWIYDLITEKYNLILDLTRPEITKIFEFSYLSNEALITQIDNIIYLTYTDINTILRIDRYGNYETISDIIDNRKIYGLCSDTENVFILTGKYSKDTEFEIYQWNIRSNELYYVLSHNTNKYRIDTVKKFISIGLNDFIIQYSHINRFEILYIVNGYSQVIKNSNISNITYHTNYGIYVVIDKSEIFKMNNMSFEFVKKLDREINLFEFDTRDCIILTDNYSFLKLNL